MRKGTVLLIFPDFDNPSRVFGIRLRSYGPPLGILFLASQLESAGYQVKVIDFSAEPYNKDLLLRYLKSVDVVGITALSYSRKSLQRIVHDIRDIDRAMPIVIGGPACTAEAKFAKEMNIELQFPEGVDLMVIGEAEVSIVQILDSLMQSSRGRKSANSEQGEEDSKDLLTKCAGVIFRDKSGEIHWGKSYEEPADLNAIESPAFRLINRRAYTLFGKNACGIVAPIITSRGCPYRCRFCTRATKQINFNRQQFSPVNQGYYETFRLVKTSRILDEIEALYNAGFKVLYVVDDNFTVNEKRVHKIMDGIIQRGIQMAIMLSARVDRCSEELYSKMRAAGVQLISFGLESGNQDVLDYYQKGTTIEQAYKAVELADSVGIFTHGTFILGAPVETEEHIQNTVDFARGLSLDSAFFGVLNYTYGSQLWQEAYSKGLIKSFERDVLADSNRGLGKLPKEWLLKVSRQAQYQFHLRPSLWIRYINKLKCIEPEFAKLLIRGVLRFGADFLTWKNTSSKQYYGSKLLANKRKSP